MSKRYLAFPNKYKKDNEKAPDFKMYVQPEEKGTPISKYSIGGIWIGESKNGQYMSINIEDKEYDPKEHSDSKPTNIPTIRTDASVVQESPVDDIPVIETEAEKADTAEQDAEKAELLKKVPF